MRIRNTDLYGTVNTTSGLKFTARLAHLDPVLDLFILNLDDENERELIPVTITLENFTLLHLPHPKFHSVGVRVSDPDRISGVSGSRSAFFQSLLPDPHYDRDPKFIFFFFSRKKKTYFWEKSNHG